MFIGFYFRYFNVMAHTHINPGYSTLLFKSYTHTHAHIFLNFKVCIVYLYHVYSPVVLLRQEASSFTSKLLFLSLTAFIHCIHSHTHVLYMLKLTFVEAPRTAVQQKSNAVSVRCVYLTVQMRPAGLTLS